MKKHIWLVNYYSLPPEHEIHLRTNKFGEYLQKEGYEVTIVSSNKIHHKDINLNLDKKFIKTIFYNGLKFVHLRVFDYKKSKFRRFISILGFHFSLHFFRKKISKPDYILHSSVPPFGFLTILTAKFLRAKYISDIQDLWPEGFVTYEIMKRNSIFIRFSYLIEKYIYRFSDAVIFSMEGGVDYLREKKWLLSEKGIIDDKKIFHINNGVDLNQFNYFKDEYIFKNLKLDNKSTFKVLYIGSIRFANNIGFLVDAASYLKEYKEIEFHIYGDGEEREQLEKLCFEKKNDNVYFGDRWINPNFVPNILTKSNLNVLNYKPNKIWEYGGSQTKLFQYMASGKPILSNIDMGHCIISKKNLGTSKTFQSSKEYADEILSIYKLDKEKYEQICRNVLKESSNYDYSMLTKKLIKILKKLQ